MEHSENFESVEWKGTTFTFTPMQRAVVRILFESLGKPVSQATINSKLDPNGTSNDRRIRDVFRQHKTPHPAWGTMIKKHPGAKDCFFIPRDLPIYDPHLPQEAVYPANERPNGGGSASDGLGGKRMAAAKVIRPYPNAR